MFESVVSGALRAGQALVKLGLDTQRQEDAFARLTASLGVNGEALANALEGASRGLADASDVMTTAASALQEGLKPEQLVKTMEIATAQSKLMGTTVTEAFNQITRAILAQQERGLKTAGIYVDMTGALEEHARSLGVTVDRLADAERTQALYNAVVAKTSGTLQALNSELLTNAQQVEKAATAWQNFLEGLGKNLVNSGAQIVAWAQQAGTAIESFAEKMAGVRKGIEEFFLSRKDTLLGGLVSPLIAAGVASRDAQAAVAGAAKTVGDLGVNSAAAGPKIKDTATSLKATSDAAKKAAEEVKKIDTALREAVTGFDADVLEAGWKRVEAQMETALKVAQDTDATLAAIPGDFEGDVLEAQWARIDARMAEALSTAIAIDAVLDGMADNFEGDIIEAQWARIDASMARAADQAANIDAILDGIQDNFEGDVIEAQMRRQEAALDAAAASSNDWRKAIESGFLSITDTFSKMADGLIAGTLEIGDAFANLGRNLLTNFVQLVLHQVFDPILKAAASFVSDLIGMLTGRSGSGSIVGGLLGFVGSLFGSGGGGASWVEGSTGLLELAGSASGGAGGGVGMLSTLGDVGSALSTLYSVVAYVYDLPSLLSLAASGLTTVGEALGILTPALVQLSGPGVTAGIAAAAEGISAGVSAGAVAPTVGLSGVAGTVSGVLGTLAPLFAMLSFVIDDMLGDELRRYLNRQRFIQSEGFTNTLQGQLEALESAQSTLTTAMRTNLSVLGAVAAKTQARAPSAAGEAWDLTLGDPNVGPIDWQTQPSRDAAIEAARNATDYITPFLEELARLGIEQFQGEKHFEIITQDFEGMVRRWTAVLRQFADVGGTEQEQALSRVRLEAALTAASLDVIAEALGVARQAIPDFAQAAESEIPAMLAAMKDGLVDAFMADPVKITGLLDIGSLQKEGEDAQATILRMATALVGLDDTMERVAVEAQALRGELDVPAEFARAMDDIAEAMEAAQGALTTTRDPEQMLAAAQQIEALIQERLRIEIETVTALIAQYREYAAAATASIAAVASVSGTLDALGVSFEGMTASAAAFVTGLDDAEAQLTALPALISTAFAEFGQLAKVSIADALDVLLSSGDVMNGFVERATSPIDALRDTFDGVMKILDPQARASALQAFLGQIDSFFQQATTGIRSYYAEAEETARGLADAVIQGIRDAASAQTAPLEAQRDAAQDGLAAIQLQREAIQGWIADIRDLLAVRIAALNEERAAMLAPLVAMREAAQAGIDATNEWRDALLAPQEAMRDQAQAGLKALAAWRDATQEQIQVIRDALRVRLDALEEERSGLQDILRAAQEAARVAKSLRDAISGLEIGDLAPPDADAQLAAARLAFETASPEDAGAAGRALLETALRTGLKTLPDPEYVALFEEVTARLRSLAEQAEASASPEMESLARLGAIEEEIKRLNAEATAAIAPLEATLESIDAQSKALNASLDVIASSIEAINDNADATITTLTASLDTIAASIGGIDEAFDAEIERLTQLAADAITPLEATLATLETQSEELTRSLDVLATAIEGINAQADTDIAAVNESLKAHLSVLSADEQAAIDRVKNALEPIAWRTVQGLGDVTVKLQELAQQAHDQLREITRGADPQAFIAERTDAAAHALEGLGGQIDSSLRALVASRLDALVDIGRAGGDTALRDALKPPMDYIAKFSYISAQNLAVIAHGMAGDIRLGSVAWPSYARGTPFVQETGPAMLHRGERVLTAAENRTYPATAAASPVTITFSPTITVTGSDDPEALARKLIRPLERELRKVSGTMFPEKR